MAKLAEMKADENGDIWVRIACDDLQRDNVSGSAVPYEGRAVWILPGMTPKMVLAGASVIRERANAYYPMGPYDAQHLAADVFSAMEGARE